MLKKLLKYELRATSRTIFPLLLVTFALSLLSSAAFVINKNFLFYERNNAFLQSLFTFFIATAYVAIIGAGFVLIMFLLRRYYKSFFMDEGYLTFTTPANAGTHIAVKTISAVIWNAAGFLVIAGSLYITTLFATAESGRVINVRMITEIAEDLAEAVAKNGIFVFSLYFAEYFILAVTMIVFEFSIYYLAITIGSIIARKHKIIASIGFLFVIYNVLWIVLNIFVFYITPSEFFSNLLQSKAGDHILLIFASLVAAALSWGVYGFNGYLLKTKLNLE